MQKQEESIGGRKGGKEDRRKGREAGRDRTRYEVSVVMRGEAEQEEEEEGKVVVEALLDESKREAQRG